MLNLIPAVKSLKVLKGVLRKKTIFFEKTGLEPRFVKALRKLPVEADGVKLSITVTGTAGEGYTLSVAEDAIAITAESNAGAFYAIQTLRQLFTHESVPCVQIEDAPDFPYRGFYHDITRGRISKVETLLQLYVEHVFPFKETADLVKKLAAHQQAKRAAQPDRNVYLVRCTIKEHPGDGSHLRGVLFSLFLCNAQCRH